MQTTWKNKARNMNIRIFLANWKLRVWYSLFHYYHVICKISNLNMWTAKHLARASCTELTLKQLIFGYLVKKVIMKRNSNSFFFQAVTISVYLAKVVFNRLKSDKVFFQAVANVTAKSNNFPSICHTWRPAFISLANGTKK